MSAHERDGSGEEHDVEELFARLDKPKKPRLSNPTNADKLHFLVDRLGEIRHDQFDEDTVENLNYESIYNFRLTDRQNRYAVALVKYLIQEKAFLNDDYIMETPLKELFGFNPALSSRNIKKTPNVDTSWQDAAPTYDATPGGGKKRSRQRKAPRALNKKSNRSRCSRSLFSKRKKKSSVL